MPKIKAGLKAPGRSYRPRKEFRNRHAISGLFEKDPLTTRRPGRFAVEARCPAAIELHAAAGARRDFILKSALSIAA
jgi:hypothetical protein